MHSSIPIRIVNASSNPQIGDLFVYGSEFLICLVQNLENTCEDNRSIISVAFLEWTETSEKCSYQKV